MMNCNEPGKVRKLTSGRQLLLLAITSVAMVSNTMAGDSLPLFNDGNSPPFLPTAVTFQEPDTQVAPASVDPLDPLDARFLALEEELRHLKLALSEKPKAASSMAPAAPVYPSVKVTGFFQADSAWFRQDAASTATVGDVQDDRGFRRARIAAIGKVADNVSYQLEMDFAFNGRPSFMDVWLDISKVPVFGNVRIGQWRQPFGLDELTSVKELTFLERPLMFGMAPFRQFGIGFHDSTADENATWAASIFGSGTDAFGNSIGDRGYGGAARVTRVLLEDTCNDFLVHIGGGYSFVANPDSNIRYRNVPEFGGPVNEPGSVPFFVDTLPIPAENANLFNAELAGTWGPLHAQSELRYSLVNTDSGNNATFPSYYAQMGWIMTGEHRPYNKTSAALGRIKPAHPVGTSCGFGAWEVAVRYSWIDLNDGLITGGELTNMTYGLNWYLNNYTKMQFNYIKADLNRAPVGSSDTDIFAVRAQLEF